MASVWERMITWLRAGPAEGRDPEGEALAQELTEAYRKDVLPGLLTALKSSSPHIVRAACGTVRKLGAEAAPAVPILTAIAQSPLPRGADIQQEYARMDALHALNDILGEIERVRQREARRAEDEATAVRERAAVEARAAATREPAETTQREISPLTALLLGATRDPEPSVRVAAWEALAERGLTTEEVTVAAKEAMGDPDPEVRRAAVRAIGRTS